MKKKIIFVILFIALGLIALQIPFTNIIGGSTTKFSLFDFFAPASGLFIGSIWGAIAVAIVKVIEWIVKGSTSMDLFTFIRFFTLAAAAWYFGSKKKYVAILPLICMMLFWMHPVGRAAWYYALYWLLPLIAVFKKDSLALNSLGATFTAHALGSIGFLYTIPTTPELWTNLVPIVFMERMLMTAGIWVAYPIFNSLLNILVARFAVFNYFQQLVNQKYLISRDFFKKYV